MRLNKKQDVQIFVKIVGETKPVYQNEKDRLKIWREETPSDGSKPQHSFRDNI